MSKNLKKFGLDPEYFDISKYLEYIKNKKRKEDKKHGKRKRNT